jgi:chromosome segregation ATPase
MSFFDIEKHERKLQEFQVMYDEVMVDRNKYKAGYEKVVKEFNEVHKPRLDLARAEATKWKDSYDKLLSTSQQSLKLTEESKKLAALEQQNANLKKVLEENVVTIKKLQIAVSVNKCLYEDKIKDEEKRHKDELRNKQLKQKMEKTDLEKLIVDVQATANSLQDDLKSAKDKSSSLEIELVQTRFKLASAMSNMSSLQQKLDKAEADARVISETFQQESEIKKIAQDKQDSLKSDLDIAKSQILVFQKAQDKFLNNEKDYLKTIEDLKKKIKTLETGLDKARAFENDLVAEKTRSSDKESIIVSLKKRLQDVDLAAKIDAQTIENRDKEIFSLNSLTFSLRGEVLDLKEQIKRLVALHEDEISSLNTLITNLKKEIDDLKEQLKKIAASQIIQRRHKDDDSDDIQTKSVEQIDIQKFDTELLTIDFKRLKRLVETNLTELTNKIDVITKEQINQARVLIELEISYQSEKYQDVQKSLKEDVKTCRMIKNKIKRIAKTIFPKIDEDLRSVDKIIQEIEKEGMLIRQIPEVPNYKVQEIIEYTIKTMLNKQANEKDFELNELKNLLQSSLSENKKIKQDYEEIKKALEDLNRINNLPVKITDETRPVKNTFKPQFRQPVYHLEVVSSVTKKPVYDEKLINCPMDETEMTNEIWVERCKVKPFLSNTSSMPYDDRMCQGEWSFQKNINQTYTPFKLKFRQF